MKKALKKMNNLTERRKGQISDTVLEGDQQVKL